jgi:DNA-binding transcriptional ArsR family regulator
MFTGMVPDGLLEEAARWFSLLGDPTRLRLLRALEESGELSVGELAQLTGVSRVNVSQHLARLAAGGLVARRRRGTSVIYRVADETIAELCQIVCEGVRARAQQLAIS